MNNILTLDKMRNMHIDDIITLYQNGYTIEENVNNLEHRIVSTDVSVSTGSLFLIGTAVLVYILIRR